jgi:FkbM family methyltransferase
MPWTQYSRNLEDVMLRRALGGVKGGFFLDVGAYHPVVDNNTYALYLQGWRGIAVEPLFEFRDAWEALRPGDILLDLAVSSRNGEKTLYVVAGEASQLSTLDARHAARWRAKGFQVLPRPVPAITLNAILESYLDSELHALCLDVEGSEAEALEGLDLSRYRPWLMVIEAIQPVLKTEAHAQWEPALVAAGYEFVYFDGANRFYVAREHAELRDHFSRGPDSADDFVRYQYKPG